MTDNTITKKFKLKPGIHQFAPRSHPVHHNDNLTDEEAEWYLEKYPHIAGLFERDPRVEKIESLDVRESNGNKIISDEQSLAESGQINNSIIQ